MKPHDRASDGKQRAPSDAFMSMLFKPEELPSRNNPLPLHYQVYKLLREKMESGLFTPGEALPPEQELEKSLGVSRVTVRRALSDLAADGYVIRRTGRGTFVLRTKIEDTRNHILGSLAETLRLEGHEVYSRVLHLERVPPQPKVAAVLNLPHEAQEVLWIERLIIADQESIALSILYLMVDDDVQFTQEELEVADSVFPILASRYGIVTISADKTLEATVAMAREAQLLHIREGDPLLLAEIVIYVQPQRPFAFGKTLYRGDRYKYRLHLRT